MPKKLSAYRIHNFRVQIQQREKLLKRKVLKIAALKLQCAVRQSQLRRSRSRAILLSKTVQKLQSKVQQLEKENRDLLEERDDTKEVVIEALSMIRKFQLDLASLIDRWEQLNGYWF